MNRLSLLLLACAPLGMATDVQAQSQDDYAGMLTYLADSRIDGNALSGSSGAVAVNMAAGDLNLQTNLHSMAVGKTALASVNAIQKQRGNRFDMPLHASATLGGQALVGANGIVSINQASGSGNAELNSVVAVLADQGIRETTNEAMASAGSFVSAGGQGTAGGLVSPGTRKVGVEASALRGFEGVLQLNQIAGSSNATENHLSISVQPIP